MTEFTLDGYEPSDRAQVLELMRAVGRAHLDDAEFEWWFERNPSGPRLISVARADGAVVGAVAMSLFRLRVQDREHVLAVPVHGATAAGHRRLGVFSALELRNEQRAAAAGASAAIAFPNARSRRALQGIEWRDLPSMRIWARPLDVVSALRRRATGGLRPRAEQTHAAAGDAPRVEPLSRFDPRAEVVWKRSAAGRQIVRDAEFLNWRYVDTPREYRCFGAYDGATLLGFTVLGHTIKRGVSAGYVADLVAAEHAVRIALLRRCVAELEPGTAALVSAVRSGERRAFVRAGFVPTHARIRVLGKPLADGAAIGGNWRFTLGDLDFL